MLWWLLILIVVATGVVLAWWSSGRATEPLPPDWTGQAQTGISVATPSPREAGAPEPDPDANHALRQPMRGRLHRQVASVYVAARSAGRGAGAAVRTVPSGPTVQVCPWGLVQV